MGVTGDQSLVEYGVGLFGYDEVDAIRPRIDGGAVRRNIHLERYGVRKQEPKSVLDVEKTPWNSLRMSSKAVITGGDQPEP